MLVATKKDLLHIELHGREQFWALKAKVDIPLKSIKKITYEPKFNDWRKWELRIPGSHIPKMLIAGSYWTEEGWDFMYIKRPIGFVNPLVQDVLVIKTDQDKYKRVIIGVEESTAKKVLNWWKNSKRPKTIKSHSK